MAQKNLRRLELLFKNALDRSQDGGVVLQGILDAAAFVIVQVGAGQVSEGKHAEIPGLDGRWRRQEPAAKEDGLFAKKGSIDRRSPVASIVEVAES